MLARFIPVTAKTIISSLSFFGFVFLSLGKKAEQLATTGNCEVTCSVHLSPLKPHLPQVAQARIISIDSFEHGLPVHLHYKVV